MADWPRCPVSPHPWCSIWTPCPRRTRRASAPSRRGPAAGFGGDAARARRAQLHAQDRDRRQRHHAALRRSGAGHCRTGAHRFLHGARPRATRSHRARTLKERLLALAALTCACHVQRAGDEYSGTPVEPNAGAGSHESSIELSTLFVDICATAARGRSPTPRLTARRFVRTSGAIAAECVRRCAQPTSRNPADRG